MSDRAKIYILKPDEGWVVDLIGSDFERLTGLEVVDQPENADIVWLLGSWCWNRIDPEVLRQKTVVCTVHHIVPEKFNVSSFRQRDKFVDVYFVYTHETSKIIRQHSRRSIARVAHWIDPTVWPITPRDDARGRLGISRDDFVVGSFQRDTEGSDLISPKLEKGPDILCDLIERMSENRPITLLLGGWRREYVLSRASHMSNVKVVYKQLPPQDTIKDMYAACDLYLCTSRHEGGPMCLLEAPVMRVPILSTRVGIAEDVLHPSQIIAPATWDFSMPTQEAIDFSYSRALERGPSLVVASCDSLFSLVLEMSREGRL